MHYYLLGLDLLNILYFFLQATIYFSHISMNVNLMSHACHLLSRKVFGEFKKVNLFLAIDEKIDKLR